jgi:citrate synthase
MDSTRSGFGQETARMTDFSPGLEGVVAFETEIAEPDKAGSALRYRGVDIEELVGQVPYEQIWGLLVDGSLEPGLPAVGTEPLPVRTGSIVADIQAGIAAVAGTWPLGQFYDIDEAQAREDLARVSDAVFAFTAQSARGDKPPVDDATIAGGSTLAERFLIRWRGEADKAQAQALDAYLASAAEHGLNASTFTARVIASTGADAGACISGAIGALSGPLHGGAPTRVMTAIEEVERTGDPEGYVKKTLDAGGRLMGFGHRVYRAEDPRARVLRRTARELGTPRYEVAEALEKAALAELRARKPDRVLETNVDYWASLVLDFVDIPSDMFTPLFACARTAGWSAHCLEQKRLGKLVRPAARYTGPAARSLSSL